jgi:ABC-type Fe3+/spermidine/putrescine transport system ATPase subunit
MDRGRIAQEGSPEEIYRKPSTSFVADFVGQCNLIDGVVEHVGDHCLVVASNELKFAVNVDTAEFAVGAPVTLVVRPESVQLRVAPVRTGEANAFAGRLESNSFFGDHFRSEVVIGPIRLATLSRSRPPGGDVVVTIDPGDMVVLSRANDRGVDRAL